MCHDPSSRPPAPPRSGQVASSGPLDLTAADGSPLAAYEAVPAGEPVARIVVLPDIRGLHPYYRALAERFAEAGLHAVAVDYFARTAGAGLRGDDFDWQAHIKQVTPEGVRADVSAARDHLDPDGSQAVFTVGFCFGGGHSWRLAASGLGLAGCMGFYGRLSLLEEAASDVAAPLLMLIAGADAATPTQDAVGLARRLQADGKQVEAHVFDGAPHSFFDRSFAEHADDCSCAWEYMLAFVEAHSPRRTPIQA